jgi:histidine ammonia-lyase
VAANAARVLACELLCAAQGLEFHKPLRPGRGAEAAYRHIREQVRPLDQDRPLHGDLAVIENMVCSGSLLQAVEQATGALA